MELDKVKLLSMWKTMNKIRQFETRISDLFMDQRIPGFIHLYLGEEAIAAGVCANLRDTDQIASTHRGHGHCIAKGGRLDLMMAELYGKSTGYCKGKGGSMHIADRALGILGADGIVGAGMPIATGAAFGMKYLKTDDVAVVFFGDGASNRGTFHESLNMASTWKLPVVFVNENNGMGLYTRQARHQNIINVSDRSAGYGIPGVTADGNNILEVYEVAKEAITRARQGFGPTLLEFKTWRQRGHFVGDPELYRTDEERKEWMARDPIPRFEKYLLDFGVSKEELDSIVNDVASELEAAVKFAEESPYPELSELTAGTYAK